MSASTDCAAFEGVFHDRGRLDPRFPIFAPLPDPPSGASLGRNTVLLGERLGEGSSSEDQSFALRYADGRLDWIAVSSRGGSVLGRGSTDGWTCEDGVLSNTSSGWFAFEVFGAGRMSSTVRLVVNEDGWLASYDMASGYGVAFWVIPGGGTTYSKWMEFPPDPSLAGRLDELFAGRSPEPGQAASVQTGSAPRRCAPEDALRRVALRSDGVPQEIGELSLELEQVRSEPTSDGFATLSATVTVRGVGATRGWLGNARRVTLTKHTRTDEVDYLSLGEQYIGLDDGSTDPLRDWAVLQVRPKQPPRCAPPRGASVLSLDLDEDAPVAVGDVVWTLESVDVQYLGSVDRRRVVLRRRSGGRSERIELVDDLPRVAPEFRAVGDDEIALDDATPYRFPPRATILLRRQPSVATRPLN